MKQLYIKSLKIIILLLLVSVAGVQAQALLSGKVSDKESTLTGVSVNVSGVGGTITNVDGKYSLKLAKGSYTVTFSYIGYLKVTKQVTITNDDVVLDIVLVSEASALNEVVVLGGRGVGRTKMESAVPVDVINMNSVNDNTAKPDLMSQLNQAVPSFNFNRQSGTDGADAIDLASLRGLGNDQTLVLINGIRRHLTAYVDPAQSGRGRGNSGTDLNAIPEMSIDRIEILRDGASAQYGSDAIAGVMNIILKKDINHLVVDAGFSGYDDQKHNSLNYSDPSQLYTGKKFDGQTFTVGGDYGFALGKNGGFLNIAGNYLNSGKTFRFAPGFPISLERRAFGDGSVEEGGGMFNLEMPIAGTKTVFYSFGGYNYKHSNVYAYTRSWNYQGGAAGSRVSYTKFPTDPTTGDLIFVPGIMLIAGDPSGAYKSSEADNVFYDPEEDVYITDQSAAVGLKGTTESDWDWNISNNTGRNDFHYFGNKTFNAALINQPGDIQTRFDDGGFSYLQNTTNIDLTKRIKTIAQGLQLSFGGETRYERYDLYAGELNSYYGSTTAVPVTVDGVTTQVVKASGSEGYPGYQPSDARIANRGSEAIYAEGALDVTKLWLIDGAARFENYSDFGSQATFKFATRYKVTDNFNLRGSVSTGFRAPNLQQINFSNTNTTVSQGQLQYTKTIPNYSEIARLANIPKLTAETSANYSVGFTWQPVHELTLTVDGYQVDVKNRVVVSGSYSSTDPSFSPALVSELAAKGIQNVVFFTNAVNTTNRGVDIVLDYKKRWGKEHFNATLAGNIQDVIINKINIPSTFKRSASDSANFFSDREQYFMKYNAPKAKFTLGLEYGASKLSFGTRFTYYGDVKELGTAGGGAVASDPYFPSVALDANPSQLVPEIFNFSPKVTTDIYISYKLKKSLLWTVGIDNLFNVHPDEAFTKGSVSPTGNSSYDDSNSGGPYEPVQMGFNGTRIFTKLRYNF
jgi:iron complex outermembrane receptor protein